MRSWFKALAGIIVVATIGGISAMTDATTSLFLSREELVRISDVIARVKVGKAVFSESEDHTKIVTRTELNVTQALKGVATGRITVQQIGGTYNGKTARVLGDAKLISGEDAVVFLKRDEKGMTYFSVLSQSVYHIDDKGMARRNLEGMTLFKRSGEKMEPIVVNEHPETVESLMTDIKRLAAIK